MIRINLITLTDGRAFSPVIVGRDLTTGQNIIQWVEVSK